MQLYTGSSLQFIDQTIRNAIAATLQSNFFEAYRYQPSRQEVMSWQNSLLQMAVTLQGAGLTDHGVTLEYQLPLSARRLDFMITGHDGSGAQHAVVVELKQWGDVGPSDAEGCVSTWLAGSERDVLHPSCQVGQYEQYLRDVHSAFSSGEVGLSSCVFLHNLQRDTENEIFQARHAEFLQAYPAFAGDQVGELKEYLRKRLVGAKGVPVMEKVLSSRYAQSKKLLEHTAKVVRNQTSYVLLDDQKVVFNKVLSRVRKYARRKDKRTMVLVQGGPGTGKSVIALHLLGELAAEGFSVLHATGSKAFTENIKKVVGSRAAAQFGYTHFNMKGNIEPGFFDALVQHPLNRFNNYRAANTAAGARRPPGPSHRAS
ncbi:DNA/RNA helicase domain-containing protein, partial [Cupriavidus necator]|uniref:DNA/RNA helicase domain-containing protein n=1 Tax=Cupriavidus necator TaxID=106590 RepID=UPI00339D532A